MKDDPKERAGATPGSHHECSHVRRRARGHTATGPSEPSARQDARIRKVAAGRSSFILPPSSFILTNMSRREDFRLVTGQGRYTADWNLPGQLHAVFLRADRAHAEIAHARCAPRARASRASKPSSPATTRAKPDSNRCPTSSAIPARTGSRCASLSIPVLAMGRVRYVGEPVAMIVADTAAIAEDARDLIDSRIPRSARRRELRRRGRGRARRSCTTTCPAISRSSSNRATQQAVAAAFARAKYVSTLTVDSQRLVGNAHGAARVPRRVRPAERALHVSSAAAGRRRHERPARRTSPASTRTRSSWSRRTSAAASACAAARIPNTSRSMIAARKLGRPVKWVGSAQRSLS